MSSPVLPDRFDASSLSSVFDCIANRVYPEVDAEFTVLPLDEVTGLAGVYSFTGHAVMSTEVTHARLVELGCDGIGMSNAPQVLTEMAGPTGMVGVLDNLTVRRGIGGGAPTLRETDAHEHEHRVQYARSTRRDVRVFANETGLVTLGVGIAGRIELGFETFGGEASRGRGLGATLIAEALALVEEGSVIWASCAPGNARSLRALLNHGFELVGSEVLISTDGPLFQQP